MIQNSNLIFKDNLLNDIPFHIHKFSNPNKIIIISDTTVSNIYLRQLMESFQSSSNAEIHVFSFADGEQSKNFSTVQEIHKFMASKNFSRSDVVIALGGGVVGDVAGFVASTYMRGVDFFQVPTTLLAQVDAAIGGKNAVNLSTSDNEVGFKNLVGTFYNPIATLIDPSLLKTLSHKNFVEGIAEIIKYGSICDSSLFMNLLNNGFDKSMIIQCAKLKTSIVEKDFHDNGLRMILNFGHTIGHAIEKISNYKISHGESVAIGMCITTFLSEKNGISENGTYESIVELVKKFSLPYFTDIPIKKIFEIIHLDKKVFNNKINLIVLERIGQAKIIFVKLDTSLLEKGVLYYV